MWPVKIEWFMEVTKLNGGGASGQIATLNNNIDRVLIIREDGSQQWMTPRAAAIALQNLMNIVTINAKGLVNPNIGKYQLSSIGTGKSYLIAKIPKSGGSIAVEIIVSAPTILSSKLYLTCRVYSSGISTLLKQIISGGAGTAADSSFKAYYTSDNEFYYIYMQRTGVVLTVDAQYSSTGLLLTTVDAPNDNITQINIE